MIAYPNAKINIGLNIIRRRSDGYHDIETLFYPLRGLYDILEIIRVEGEGNKMEFSQSGLAVDGPLENNLCVKAYNLLAQRYGMPYVKMHLHKQVPMGAGLGGGSSDAAFTLRMLNGFLERPLSDEELSAVALELGSDCPFFLINRPSIGKGRGEVLETTHVDLSGYWILLINPGIHVNTGLAYAGSSPKPWTVSLAEQVERPVTEWKNQLINDFEQTVFAKYPEIGTIKERLYELGAVYASMSGSGSSVFGIFENEPIVPEEFKPYFHHISQL